MPVLLGYRVVDRMFPGNRRHRDATAGAEVHSNRQRSRRRIEIRAGHEPWAPTPSAAANSFSFPSDSRNYDNAPEFTHSDFNRG